jgi:hypothetical protein
MEKAKRPGPMNDRGRFAGLRRFQIIEPKASPKALVVVGEIRALIVLGYLRVLDIFNVYDQSTISIWLR